MGRTGPPVRQVEVPALGKDGAAPVFATRAASPVSVARRIRGSSVDLAPLFGDADVISVRAGRAVWYLGRSAEWTRRVIGSRSLWADIDILQLGLGDDPVFYAMGGLPGAPPGRHRAGRRTAIAGSPHRGIDDGTVRESMALATDLALDRVTGVLDIQLFARALFLRTSAAAFCGLDIDAAAVTEILGWFDRWSKIISSPLSVVGRPWLPFGPAGRLRKVLALWYAYLAGVLRAGPAATGLAGALSSQAEAGEITMNEAVGILATVMFAGTEPPAHTLLWAYSHCVAVGPRELGTIDKRRAEALLWESFRVRPAVNVIVRRLSSSDTAYRSSSSDVYVVAPPLAHQRSNALHGLPPVFSPSVAGPTNFDPNEYPGLGAGVHHCIGARAGMQVALRALTFLLEAATVVRPPDIAPHGIVTSRPRRLPVVTL